MEICLKKLLGFSLLFAGLASCGVGLWLLLSPAQYQATARIAVMEMDNSESEHYFNAYPERRPTGVYDWYSIQPIFITIRSESILSKVALALNLHEEWRKKYCGGGTLTTNAAIAMLKKHLNLAGVRNTRLIEISFTSGDPNEAARIANAIAEAYQGYRVELRNQVLMKGIEVLKQEYQAEEKKLQMLQTNVDLLREKYQINKNDEFEFDNPNITFPRPSLTPTEREERQKEYERTKLFWEQKRELNMAMDLHRLLQAKINSVKLDLQTPTVSMVSIIDVAQPPKSPVGPNRSLRAVLLALGLLSTAVGFLLLRSSRHPA